MKRAMRKAPARFDTASWEKGERRDAGDALAEALQNAANCSETQHNAALEVAEARATAAERKYDGALQLTAVHVERTFAALARAERAEARIQRMLDACDVSETIIRESDATEQAVAATCKRIRRAGRAALAADTETKGKS